MSFPAIAPKKITAAAERRLDLADRLAAVMVRSDFHPIN